LEAILVIRGFTNLFDLILHDAICDTIRKDSKLQKIIGLLRVYNAEKDPIRVTGELSDLVLIKEGVGEGCVLPTSLLYFVIDRILRIL